VTVDAPAFTLGDWSLYLSLLPSVKMGRAGVYWVVVDRTIPYSEFSGDVTGDAFWDSLAGSRHALPLLGLQEALPKGPGSCRADLEHRNETSVFIVARREVPWVKVLPDEQVTAVFSRGGWQEFRAEFPKGLGVMRFSLPGYSPDGRSAVVYQSWSSGPQAGWSGLIYLGRGPKGWVRCGSWPS
jgi:hypothetical protein